MKRIKTVIAMLLMTAGALQGTAQTLEKMNWFNEPAAWSISGGKHHGCHPKKRLLAYIALRLYR